jgi:broad specificity phosphatase PhoE
MIYLLRHGETVWNAVGRFQGRKDSPLTQRGIEQANQMGMLLSQEIAGREAQFKSYVSPLGRAKETAARIAKIVPLTFEEEPRLMEVSVGSWDGMTLYEIGVEYPDALNGSDAFDWLRREFRSGMRKGQLLAFRHLRADDRNFARTYEPIITRCLSWIVQARNA